jgi:EAL and modified HD-GYP domain-containing signal transduction protein
MYDFFIGRQVIYDDKLAVFGYTLLLHSNDTDQIHRQESQSTASQIMLHTMLEMGWENMVGNRRAFIKVSRDFILSDLIMFLDKERMVLEISENTPPDDEVVAALGVLATEGYSIALSNFLYDEAKRPFLDVAEFVKLDVSSLGADALRGQIELLRKHNVKLVANMVETQRDFKLCDELGMDYFQGSFLTRPNIIKDKRLPANRICVLQLLEKLQNPKVQLRDIGSLVREDLYLSYRLLRYINSSYFGFPRKVESIQHAMIMVGLERIRVWVSLIALSKLDDKPNALLVTALSRAKMCELLAVSSNMDNIESYFTVGLFSVLDAIMERPMSDLLDTLPLSQDVNRALLNREGVMGMALQCVLDYEQGKWNAIKFDDLDNTTIVGSYVHSLDWASELGADLLGS